MSSPGAEKTAYDRVTVPSFDRIGVEVLSGRGLVARSPGAVLVVAEPEEEQLWSAIQGLIAQVAEASLASPRAPGSTLIQVVTAWHAAEPAVSFGLLAATDDGLTLCLSGTAEAGLPETGHHLSATDEGGWLIRQLPWPDTAMVVSLGKVGGVGGVQEPRERPVLDLHAGVVPGAGVRLAAPSVADIAVDQSQRLDQLPPPPSPVAVEEPVGEPEISLPPQARVSVLFGPAEPAPARAPLPIARTPSSAPAPEPPHPSGSAHAPPGQHLHAAAPDHVAAAPAAPPAPAEEEGVLVDGFLCSRGHLNDPRGHFCAQCGIRMAELTGIITKGRRPPLGLLLFDNGATFVLDHDYLIGREPESDPQVRSGTLRPLVLLDDSGGISRQHAEIRMNGWDVVLIDRGSANGTLVALRDAQQWRAVVPGQPIGLLPGMRISMGRRTLSFETPHRTT